ncbi:hypothetical protein ABZY31_21015 [Streptomyces sp. NPDC006529]|uniref:hypothetical protein n=1 Tax=Streptomyces sp. NPDC006529 TaxID=3157177 RepID=UPI0033B5C5A2
MRRLRSPLATLALAVPVLLGLGAGPGTTAVGPATTAAGPMATAAAGPGATTVSGPVATTATDPTGETISLRGNRPGELLDVTLVAVTDPAAPRAAHALRDPAGRLVAVEFRLLNTGTAAYADPPRSGSYLLDADGERYSGVALPTTAGAEFTEGRSLAPGDSATGCVTFELPQDARASAVQFALNSGSADDIGQWSLS